MEPPTCEPPTDLPEVAGQDAPADPALQPHLPMIGTAGQSVLAAQTADATFNACPPAIASPPGPTPLPLALLSRCGSAPGNHHVADSQGLRLFLDPCGMDTPVSRQQAWGVPK